MAEPRTLNAGLCFACNGGSWTAVEVERLLDHHLDRDAAYEAWADDYSVAEYAANVELGRH
jgi:hypothetical protein